MNQIHSPAEIKLCNKLALSYLKAGHGDPNVRLTDTDEYSTS